LQQQYFGQEGDLFKRRETLIKPIQDQVYNAISAISTEKGYGAVFDKSSGFGLMFSDARYDISDEVLIRLGYKK
jgi:Outer membrane protein (OmpH-like).